MDSLPGELPISSPGRLLWVTDLDDIPTALPFAIQYANRLNVEVKLLNANSPGKNGISLPRERNRAVSLLEQAASLAHASGIECDWQFETAPLHISLRNVIEAWNPNRILRLRSAGGSDRGLDSRTETILQETDVPVLVLHGKNIPGFFREPVKILFPTSLDRRSFEVAAAVLRFAQAHGAKITMLHVIDGETCRTRWTERVRAYAMARFDQVLEEAVGLQAETIIELGSLPETVARVAQTQQYNLILLSVLSGISFRSDICPGSAYNVLRLAPCPVLVCKENGQAQIYASKRMEQSLIGPLHLPPA